MRSPYKLLVCAFAFTVFGTGCTHTQLRYNHTRQARTLTGIYEKQVLDNLAMFRQNPNALPFFAVPKAGQAQVTDSGALSASPLNGPVHTTLSLQQLSRSNGGSWQIEPVSDPTKLKLMRCAYRRAIGLDNPNDLCTNCCDMQQDWVGVEKTPDNAQKVCCGCCRIRPLKMEEGKKFLRSPCDKVGNYCGTHIRLCSDKCTQENFTQLVFTILDYAINDSAGPYSKPQMDVEHYHYKKNEKNEYIVDGQGRFVIDSIDRFTADAHSYTVPIEKNEVDDTVDPESIKMMMRNQKKRVIIPRKRSVPSPTSRNLLLEGLIDSQARENLFLPSIRP